MLALPAEYRAFGHPRAVGVHVTYLRPDGQGKAEGKRPKIMLGGAGVVRLVPDEEVTMSLGLAEGIETALSVIQGHDWRPVWAAGSAGGIGAFPILSGIEALTVFADADDRGVGIAAGRRCAARWRKAGHEAQIVIPRLGEDFNDNLRRSVA
ncbi:toprim domain-containing protein [Belnapia sp. T6]|uniref:Toprim domain-containing protein n=1 Tax=Belnapia mucosa TaxID=2804532 RepID=A0ABS1VB01_9PROT|nr:toprim domain-containing protein [Belnapia mucosa]MBL6458823.1 toprim domain-containing protein [Belnapia mucosa]